MKFTVHIMEIGEWWSAICPELVVSGFGDTRQKALDAVATSMRSTLKAMAKALEEGLETRRSATKRVVRVVGGLPERPSKRHR